MASRKTSGAVIIANQRMDIETLEPHFHKPLNQAAKDLNLSLSSLKRLCKLLGVRRWPSRQLQSVLSDLKHLEVEKHQRLRDRNATEAALADDREFRDLLQRIGYLENKIRVIRAATCKGLSPYLSTALFKANQEDFEAIVDGVEDRAGKEIGLAVLGGVAETMGSGEDGFHGGSGSSDGSGSNRDVGGRSNGGAVSGVGGVGVGDSGGGRADSTSPLGPSVVSYPAMRGGQGGPDARNYTDWAAATAAAGGGPSASAAMGMDHHRLSMAMCGYGTLYPGAFSHTGHAPQPLSDAAHYGHLAQMGGYGVYSQPPQLLPPLHLPYPQWPQHQPIAHQNAASSNGGEVRNGGTSGGSSSGGSSNGDSSNGDSSNGDSSNGGGVDTANDTVSIAPGGGGNGYRSSNDHSGSNGYGIWEPTSLANGNGVSRQHQLQQQRQQQQQAQAQQQQPLHHMLPIHELMLSNQMRGGPMAAPPGFSPAISPDMARGGLHLAGGAAAATAGAAAGASGGQPSLGRRLSWDPYGNYHGARPSPAAGDSNQWQQQHDVFERQREEALGLQQREQRHRQLLQLPAQFRHMLQHDPLEWQPGPLLLPAAPSRSAPSRSAPPRPPPSGRQSSESSSGDEDGGDDSEWEESAAAAAAEPRQKRRRCAEWGGERSGEAPSAGEVVCAAGAPQRSLADIAMGAGAAAAAATAAAAAAPTAAEAAAEGRDERRSEEEYESALHGMPLQLPPPPALQRQFWPNLQRFAGTAPVPGNGSDNGNGSWRPTLSPRGHLNGYSHEMEQPDESQQQASLPQQQRQERQERQELQEQRQEQQEQRQQPQPQPSQNYNEHIDQLRQLTAEAGQPSATDTAIAARAS